MITEELNAWLLHKQPSGDTSILLTFFSKEKGLFKAKLRGGRSFKKNTTPVQAFTPLWLAVVNRHDWYYLNGFEQAGNSIKLQGLSLFAGLYLNELLYYLASTAELELFQVYELTLHGLSQVNNRLAIEALLRRFEMSLLAACGQALIIKEEADTGKPIHVDGFYQYIAGAGFIAATNGLPGKDILALAEKQFDNLDVLKVAKWIMRKAIDHLLDGRELKSRSLLPELSRQRS